MCGLREPVSITIMVIENLVFLSKRNGNIMYVCSHICMKMLGSYDVKEYVLD